MDDPGQQTRLAALIGGGAGALAGGDADAVSAGANAAVATHRYNYLSHEEQRYREVAREALAQCEAGGNCSDAELAELQEEIRYWDDIDAARDEILMDACGADPSGSACRAAITDALVTVGYLPDQTGITALLGGSRRNGYADLAMRLQEDGTFGGLSNQALAQAIYGERLETLALLGNYPDAVEEAMDGYTRDAAVNAALAVITAKVEARLSAKMEQGGGAAAPVEAANTAATQIAPKIERQMGRRGWDRTSIDDNNCSTSPDSCNP